MEECEEEGPNKYENVGKGIVVSFIPIHHTISSFLILVERAKECEEMGRRIKSVSRKYEEEEK